MQGILVFKSPSDALSAGFQIYDRAEDGYLVHTKINAGAGLSDR